MTKQRRNQRAAEQQKRGTRAGVRPARRVTARRPKASIDESTRVWLGDVDSGVAEDGAYDASGAATGGGVDTPTAVEKSTESAVRKRKPIDQGSSAYTGGGADNGTDL